MKKILTILILLILVDLAVAQTYTAPSTHGASQIDVDETIAGSGTITFASLEVTDGAVLTIPAGVTLVVDGTFENIGSTIIVDGALVLNGAGAENKSSGTISGSGSLTVPAGIENTGGSTVFGSTDPNPDCTAGCSEASLPVELLYFYAENEAYITLNWATAVEINNDFFSIERSEDGEQFYEIARVDGHGNSNQKNAYRFTDKFILSPVEFYRLKQVDFDGQFEYFHIIRAETNLKKEQVLIRAYPTIVRDKKIFLSSSNPFQVNEISIYRLDGGEIKNLKQEVIQKNPLNYTINLTNIERGFYFMKMTSSEGLDFSTRLIIK
jgi:hypothetical protein